MVETRETVPQAPPNRGAISGARYLLLSRVDPILLALNHLNPTPILGSVCRAYEAQGPGRVGGLSQFPL